jgi:trehalose 6-phosphate phosphatase
MRHILSRANRGILRQFAWSQAVLAFDYDGTLAPLVPKPERAAMRESTRRLLSIVAEEYPCIVISGRSQGDVAQRLRGIGVRQVIGNHGLEPWPATSGMRDEVARWLPLLSGQLAGLRGVSIENKAFTLAVHYRRSRSKKAARDAIVTAARALGSVRLLGGEQVVNILPAGAPHKGIALERERARLACDTAIYVGDDETDEDVFALDQPGRLLAIRVGRDRASAAAYYIEDQRCIDDLLRVLIEARQDRGTISHPARGR